MGGVVEAVEVDPKALQAACQCANGGIGQQRQMVPAIAGDSAYGQISRVR